MNYMIFTCHQSIVQEALLFQTFLFHLLTPPNPSAWQQDSFTFSMSLFINNESHQPAEPQTETALASFSDQRVV